MSAVSGAQVGLLALGVSGQSADAGRFAAVLQCMAPFILLTVAGQLPLAPAVARLGASGERERLQRGLRTATRGVAAACAVLAVVPLVAPDFVLSLFGADFSDGATALRLVLIRRASRA